MKGVGLYSLYASDGNENYGRPLRKQYIIQTHNFSVCFDESQYRHVRVYMIAIEFFVGYYAPILRSFVYMHNVSSDATGRTEAECLPYLRGENP